MGKITKLKSIQTTAGEDAEVFKLGPNKYVVKMIGKKFPFVAKNKIELEKMVKFYSNSKYAVMRLEADENSSNYDDMIDEVDGIELDLDKFEKYLTFLKQKGLLKHSMYVGNAYFIETFGNDKKYLENAYKIFKEEVKGIIKPGIISTIEYNYYPEWASEDEEED